MAFKNLDNERDNLLIFLNELDSASDAAGTYLFGRSNILGTVSQSGGTPTGAVVEKGSNANGQYVRFADGTQICDFRATSSSAGAVTWTFPAAFIAIPQVVGTANQDIARMVTTSVGTTTAVNFSLWNIVNVRVDAVAVSLIAIGRWF